MKTILITCFTLMTTLLNADVYVKMTDAEFKKFMLKKVEHTGL